MVGALFVMRKATKKLIAHKEEEIIAEEDIEIETEIALYQEALEVQALTLEPQSGHFTDPVVVSEYRFGCYQEKSPKSCQLLGEYFESITREFDKALQIFETNCAKNNHGPSCSKAGFYLASGNGGIQPDPVSLSFLIT